MLGRSGGLALTNLSSFRGSRSGDMGNTRECYNLRHHVTGDLDRVIVYAEINPDYSRRGDPRELQPVLDHLGRRNRG